MGGGKPDIMCLGKALTGGYLSFAATLASENVADTISNFGVGTFMHGPTFMANPLACAAANAAVDIAQNGGIAEKVANIERVLKEGLLPLKSRESVSDVRVLGAIGVLEMRGQIDVPAVQKVLVDSGVWLRPFGKLLYTMPPFISTADQVRRITDAISRVAK